MPKRKKQDQFRLTQALESALSHGTGPICWLEFGFPFRSNVSVHGSNATNYRQRKQMLKYCRRGKYWAPDKRLL